MSRIDDRKPNWVVWQNVPACSIWEAVALSLGIDPRRVQEASWFQEGQEFRYQEGRTFDDRLVMATRQLDRPEGLVAEYVDLAHRDLSRVSLYTFVRWAQELGWEVPRELVALAEQARERKRATEDKPLSERSRKSMLRIILALANYSERHGKLPRERYAAGKVLEHFAQEFDIELKADTFARVLDEARKEIG
jgi:hypothetical protein